MRKLNSFHVAVTAPVLLGLAAASAAILGSLNWGVAFLGVGVAALPPLLVQLDRRSRAYADRARRAAGHVKQASNKVAAEARRIHAGVSRTEALIDAMQRRLLIAVESARVEAAERHRHASVD